VADEVEGVVYRAESYLSVGQDDRAERLLRDALREHPDDGALLLMLARVFEHRGSWAETVSAAAAALDANPNSLSARLLIAWASYQLSDLDEVKRQLDVVLSHVPENPTALMYLALWSSRDRSSAGRARTRGFVAQSLEHGGGDPWYTMMAARIELWLSNSAEARKLIDGGLAQHPTDTHLLQLKADLVSTRMDESLDIVNGLLANSPTDHALRERFESLVARRRRISLMALWVMPTTFAIGFTVDHAAWRAMWIVFGVVFGATLSADRRKFADQLPAAQRAQLTSKAPWRVVTRIGGRFAVVLAAFGVVGLLFGSFTGAWFLALSVFGWVAARLAGFSEERRIAASIDRDLADAKGEAISPRAMGPVTAKLARGRIRASFWMPLLAFVASLVALVPPGGTMQGTAARAAIGIIASVVTLTSFVEAAPWTIRLGATRSSVWLTIRLVVVGFVVLLIFAGSLGNLVAAPSFSGYDAPPADSPEREEPSGPATIPPDYVDDLETPQPLPSITIPDFDIPSFPPIETPAG
jgi:hypothetical protein